MTLKRILAMLLALTLLFATACERREDTPVETQPSVSSDNTPAAVPHETTLETETEPVTEEQTDSQTETELAETDLTETEDSDCTESIKTEDSDCTESSETAESNCAESSGAEVTTSSTVPSMPLLGFFLPQYGEYYYDLTNVVLYLDLYGELPPNYITKAEAQQLGWRGGSVEPYLQGGAIGGDFFGNYDGLLPFANGRTYTECDIDTDLLINRGSKRLVFSNDGLYFYTSDHYASFSEVIVTEDYEVLW